jgi:membrane associated rhomboid family serine protease
VWRQRRTPAVVAIVALNVVVFLGWQAAGSVPGMARFMATNFLVSTRHLEYGYPWTLLTATFSHQELWHLAINMFVLWNFGTILERLWGTAAFVTFYLVAAVTSSVSHCAVSSLYIGDGAINGLGASGAVAGLLLAFAFHFPRHRILLFGLVPLPALGGALAFIGLDLWGLLAQGAGGGLPIGHGAHLGGSVAGAVAYLAYFRHRIVMRES